MGVKFVDAKCPKCGASLQFPDSLDKAHCMYCGATVLVDKSSESAINIDNLIKLAERELKSKDWEKSLMFCEKAMELNPDHQGLLKIYVQALLCKGKYFFEKGFKVGNQLDANPLNK